MFKRGALEDVWNSEFYKTVFLQNRTRLRNNSFGVIKLGTVCSKITKGETPREGYQDMGTLFVKSENVLQNELNIESTDFINVVVHKRMNRSQLKKGDVLFNIVGASIGRACVFDVDKEANINQAISLIRLKPNDYSPNWLSIILNSEPYLLWINQLKSGGARDNIDLGQINSFEIPKHPKEIQSQIVEIFNQAYAEKRQKEAEAKELLASIDAYLLEQLGIVLPDKIEEKIVFYVPFSKMQGNRFDPFYHKDEFEILDRAISNGIYDNRKLGSFLSQINYGASVKSEYVADGIPFLRISDLQRNEISITEMKYLPKSMQKDIGNAFVYENDFLISRSGSIGIVARVLKEFDGFAYGSFMIKFTLFENALIDKDYLSYYLNGETMERIIRRNKIGAVQGNITIPTIKNLQIPLPPLKIQTEIANHIRNIRERTKTLEIEAKEVIEKAKSEVEKMILGE